MGKWWVYFKNNILNDDKDYANHYNEDSALAATRQFERESGSFCTVTKVERDDNE